jgi:hypothetical protein
MVTELSNTRQQLRESFEFICNLYKIWFIQTTGSVCPIFNDKLILECGTEAQNIKLQMAVANMRRALRQYLEDAKPTDELLEVRLRGLINSIQKVRKQKNPKRVPKAPQPRLSAFGQMVSEPDDLDFEKCSIVADASSEDGNALLRDYETAEEREENEGPELCQAFDLTADDMFKPYDWGFEEYSTEAVDYDRDGELLLQGPEDSMIQRVTPKGKQADVGTDSEMTYF